MTVYHLRFLRPDDSYKKTIELEFNSDKEARLFVVENYPQRATELWAHDRRVLRRTSPAHDARLRGDYPKVCLYPVLIQFELDQLATQYGLMAYTDFELIGRTAMGVYRALGYRLSNHGVWYRAVSHPGPPPTVAQHARFQFGISGQHDDGWSGLTSCNIASHVRDGTAILDDLLSDTAAGLVEAQAKIGINLKPDSLDQAYVVPPKGHLVREGLYFTGVALCPWRLKRSAAVKRDKSIY